MQSSTSNVCVAQAYHDIWIGLLLATHLRMVMVNTTTYESIKGRRWVDNSTHGKPFYVRYPTNCFRFFFRLGGESGRMAGPYGRVPNQVRKIQTRNMVTIRREVLVVDRYRVPVHPCTCVGVVQSPLRKEKRKDAHFLRSCLFGGCLTGMHTAISVLGMFYTSC